jgi:hypothetical protein
LMNFFRGFPTYNSRLYALLSTAMVSALSPSYCLFSPPY